MTYAQMLKYCLKKPGAWQDSPWPDNTVIKVGDKIFAYVGKTPPGVTLKCEPLEAELLRAQFPSLTPPEAYLRKDLYNEVPLDGSVPDGAVRVMIDKSYALVYQKLTKAQKSQIDATTEDPPQ